MKTDRWKRISELLERAFEQPDTERSRFVRDACGEDPSMLAEIRSLMRADDDAGIMLEAPIVDAGQFLAADIGPGHRFGAYSIDSLIGRGGMGEVWKAERADGAFEQSVAIKVMRSGLQGGEAEYRFRAERQILARIEHPSIARLLDGGTSEDGRPYLVMELVDGQPITEHCDSQGLDLEGRLRLFQQACRAVHHAHKHLIIHRDLKPSNILVSREGELKLLDFGIAKLLDPEEFPQELALTATGQSPLTPLYASPEQVRGEELSTASDVFSIGVVLYELLTGRKPYRLENPSAQAVFQAVLEQQPEKPSTAVREVDLAALEGDTQGVSSTLRRGRYLRGDLDIIVLKTLRKDPERRYQSVEELAADIDRFLRGEPVLARPDSVAYRLRKLVGRHPIGTALAGLSLATLMILLAFLVVERGRTLRQQTRAETVSSFLIELFASPDPTRSRGETLTVREVLDRGAQQLATGLGDQPQVEADLLEVIGRSYFNLGLYQEAESLAERGRKIRRRHGSSLERARMLRLAGEAAVELGELEAGIERHREALVQLDGSEGAEAIEARILLAEALALIDESAQAESEFATTLKAADHLGEPELLAKAANKYGLFLSQESRLDEAEAAIERSLELRRRLHGGDHPLVAESLNDLGTIYNRQARYEQAERSYLEAIEMQHRLYGGPHALLATSLGNLAATIGQLGRFDEASALFDEVLAMRREVFGNDHRLVAMTLMRRAELDLSTGMIDDGEGRLREALAIHQRALGNDRVATAINRDLLAQVLMATGRFDEALDHFENALATLEARLGTNHPQYAQTASNLGSLYYRQRDYEAATPLFEAALATARAELGFEHPETAALQFKVGNALNANGEIDAAEAAYRHAIEVTIVALGADHIQVAQMQTSLASLLSRRGSKAEAMEIALAAREVFVATNPDHPWLPTLDGIITSATRD